MNRKSISLLMLILLVSSLFLSGCERSLAPDLDEIGSEDDLMSEEAASNTTPGATEEPTEETEVPTEEASPEETAEPTEEATAEPTEEMTPEATPEPTEEATPEATEEPIGEATPSAGPGEYTVQVGDTLFSIAQMHGVSVDALARANGITNPAFIHVGQVLTIPPGDGTVPQPSPQPTAQPGTGETVHIVQPGENLFRIALRYNLDYYYLARYNNIANPAQIYVGQRIRIPLR